MIEFFSNLGNKAIASTALALITIFMVGCLKFIPVLKNMQNKQARKAIYQLCSFIVSGGLCILYHLFITKGGWNMDMLSFATLVSAEVNILYPLYENLGFRALVKKLISLFIPSKSKKINKAIDALSGTTSGELSSEEVARRQEEAKTTGWLR